MPIQPPPPHVVDLVVQRALEEDLGQVGDLTTNLLIPADQMAEARMISRVEGVLAGGVLLESIFGRLDSRVRVTLELPDGDSVSPDGTIAFLRGPARAILTGERVALNLVARLSGIATLTRLYVSRCAGRAVITDTRKTTPGLRALERYAVRCGGGRNHRFNLSDGVLIKDNHLAACGGVRQAIERARAGTPHPTRIEVEVETIEQAREAFVAGADILLLDNMAPAIMKQIAVELGGKVLLEASGGINLDTVSGVAETGVDYVSVGALTHSARSLDLSLEMG